MFWGADTVAGVAFWEAEAPAKLLFYVLDRLAALTPPRDWRIGSARLFFSTGWMF